MRFSCSEIVHRKNENTWLQVWSQSPERAHQCKRKPASIITMVGGNQLHWPPHPGAQEKPADQINGGPNVLIHAAFTAKYGPRKGLSAKPCARVLERASSRNWRSNHELANFESLSVVGDSFEFRELDELVLTEREQNMALSDFSSPGCVCSLMKCVCPDIVKSAAVSKTARRLDRNSFSTGLSRAIHA